MDKYEASVWETADPVLIGKIQDGTVTLAELLVGAIQRGVTTDDYGSCTDSGAGCTNVYAVSVPLAVPSRYMTWFQAAAAARNSGKRLPSNAEWQTAALGTPDPGTDNNVSDCNVTTVSSVYPEDPVLTGSRANCVSDVGAHDMVGNISEWVADWVPRSTSCTATGVFPATNDLNCMTGASATETPGALIRGFNFNLGMQGGVYAVSGLDPPTINADRLGFRAAR